jgi:intraflagellar transport protein 81
VTGLSEAQEKLEQVSAAKGDIDEQKGKTLEDISVLVERLNLSIAEKKTFLAPLIRDLRTLRTQSQGLEVGFPSRNYFFLAVKLLLILSRSLLGF